jgi:hypothetical protein
MDAKLKALCDKITKEGQARLKADGMSCQANFDNAVARYKIGKKYIKIDVGTSGRYMVDMDGQIFGIKAYGVIHLGHYYGTLDTIDAYNLGDYTAQKIGN